MFSAQKTANLGWFPRFELGSGRILGPSHSSAIRCLNVLEVSDHVHLLLSASKTFSTAELARRLKAGSSYWIHETFPELRAFGWQAGYGAFSVGVSQLADTVAYISGQEEHHRTKSFREEYVGFLRKHGYPDHLLTAPFTPTLRDGADLKS